MSTTNNENPFFIENGQPAYGNFKNRKNFTIEDGHPVWYAALPFGETGALVYFSMSESQEKTPKKYAYRAQLLLSSNQNPQTRARHGEKSIIKFTRIPLSDEPSGRNVPPGSRPSTPPKRTRDQADDQSQGPASKRAATRPWEF